MTEYSHESVRMFVNVTVSEHYQKLVWLTRCGQAGVVIQWVSLDLLHEWVSLFSLCSGHVLDVSWVAIKCWEVFNYINATPGITSPIASQFTGNGCMDDVTTEHSFDSKDKWVIYVLGLWFWHFIHGCLYNQALANLLMLELNVYTVYQVSDAGTWSARQEM